MTTYKIKRLSPASGYFLGETFNTMAEARAFLADVRRKYAAESPRGEKRANRWNSDRTAVHVEAGGDRLTYAIFKS